MMRQFRCTVVEIADKDDSVSQRVKSQVRELLPWADPYIASLMRKLEREAQAEHRSLGRW